MTGAASGRAHPTPRRAAGRAGPQGRARTLALVLAAGLLTGAATATRAAEAVPVAEDPVLESRVQALSEQLRCLVCQNQTLADSHAPLAQDLKSVVRDQLRAGRDEAQVIDYMTQRYGDFVLYRPPWRAATALLWLGPALLALAGLAVAWRHLGRAGHGASATSPRTDAQGGPKATSGAAAAAGAALDVAQGADRPDWLDGAPPARGH